MNGDQAKDQFTKFVFIFFQLTTFLVLPAIAFVIVWFTKPLDNFFIKLFYFFLLVYITGGFAILATKLWHYWDDRYIIFKRGLWKKRPSMKTVFFRIYIPENAATPITNMDAFWGAIHSIGVSSRTKYNVYVEGKWYYNIAFDVLIRNGKVEIYFCLAYKRAHIVKSALHSYYPDLILEESESPFKDWPAEWNSHKGMGGYKFLHGTDYKLDSQGPWPLANPEKFAQGVKPIDQLLEGLRKINPNSLIILQYVLRPFRTVYQEEWEKMLDEKKSEILSRSASFSYTNVKGEKVSATTGDLVTMQQRAMFSDCDLKLTMYHFRTHFRLMVFCPDIEHRYNGSDAEKLLKVFMNDIMGDMQMIKKDWSTASDIEYLKFPIAAFDFLDGIVGPLMNKFYFAKEGEYRRKVLYDGMLSHDVDVAADSMEFFTSTRDMACLFHFPSSLFEVKIRPQNSQAGEMQTFGKLKELREKAIEKPNMVQNNQANYEEFNQRQTNQNTQNKFLEPSQIPTIGQTQGQQRFSDGQR